MDRYRIAMIDYEVTVRWELTRILEMNTKNFRTEEGRSRCLS